MGYTVFYEEAKKKNPNIGWLNILSESFKRHSMKDLEYALAAGSAYDTASTETMLKKWHKPWVWTRVFLLLSAVGFGFWGLLQVFGINPHVGFPMLVILTCITPLTSMVLFWELNVARDISFIKLLICFFAGGLLSLCFALMFGITGVDDFANAITNTSNNGLWSSWVAPLTEEPAKLLAGFIILMLLAKGKNNIFGCTGVAVAAGVGTGFTLFESLGYVLQSTVENIYSDDTLTSFINILNQGGDPFNYSDIWQSMFKAGLNNVLGRSLPGINGHMLMCVPYIAMIALVYHETRDWKKSVFNKKTGIVFLISCILHGWWDCTAGVATIILGIDLNASYTQTELEALAESIEQADIVQECIITILYLVCNLIIIRLCLQQAVREGDYVSGQGMALGEGIDPHFSVEDHSGQKVNEEPESFRNVQTLTVMSTGRILKGAAWQCKETVLIGKLDNCFIRFPAETEGLSRAHCRLKNCGSYWTICDVGSSYGTYMNGTKLTPNTEYKLISGSVLELGSSHVQLKVW